MIDLLSSGNVEAFAALVGSAGLVPIFTGVGTMDLADPATFGIQDPNDSLGKLAALTLAARQILQTDAAGALKQIALAANKALVTDANGDVAPIDIGTLGRALLALATGTTDQYLQGDGTLQAKSGLPISTAVQTALNAKLTTNTLLTEIGGRTVTAGVGAVGGVACGVISKSKVSAQSGTLEFWLYCV
ncbi:hypothetical protein [Ochrobactrum sp. RH2CCR150]|uniref:hypothetical protein n=1 Tax=Ochrobactrum sp. RH2CCR150 TaxID=2587044 RepID=UPI0015FC02C2|nr:hypothetical protein [Ochrobactrum sp. RH2CCR150]